MVGVVYLRKKFQDSSRVLALVFLHEDLLMTIYQTDTGVYIRSTQMLSVGIYIIQHLFK